MTMLDRMRRHKAWLKWSLGLVVLAFIVFYIPDFLRCSDGGRSPTARPGGTVASVGARVITAADFTRVYNMQMQAYRNAYGGNVNAQMLKQLGIDRQILQQLIDEEVSVGEAGRLGHHGQRRRGARAHPAPARLPGERAVRRRGTLQGHPPHAAPAAHAHGVRGQRPPEHRPREAPDRRSPTGSPSRTRRWTRSSGSRNEKVKLQLVSIPADEVPRGPHGDRRGTVQVLRGNKEEFRIGETAEDQVRPRGRPEDARDASPCRRRTCQRSYNQNIDQFTSPEQVRASHILFKTEGKDDAAVEEAGRDRAGRGAEARRRLRGPRDEVLRGRRLEEPGRRPQLLQPRPHGAGVRPGGVRDGARHDQRPREDAVRLPHHQGRREAPGRHANARAKCRPQITEQIKWERAQTQAADLAAKIATEVKIGDRSASSGGEGERPRPCRSRTSSCATSRSRGSGPSEDVIAAGLHPEGRRGE